MAGAYAGFVNSAVGARLAAQLGLPRPVRLRRYSADAPLVDSPVVVAGLSWVVLRLAAGAGRDLPGESWLTAVLLGALGLGLVLAGRPVKRLVAGTAARQLAPGGASPLNGLIPDH